MPELAKGSGLMNFELSYELSLSLGFSIVWKALLTRLGSQRIMWSTGGSVMDWYSITA